MATRISVLDKDNKIIQTWNSSRNIRTLRFVFGIYGKSHKRSYTSEQLDMIVQKALVTYDRNSSVVSFFKAYKDCIKRVELEEGYF